MPTQTVSTTSFVDVTNFVPSVGLLLTVSGADITLRVNGTEEVIIPDSTTNLQFIRGHRADPINTLEVKLNAASPTSSFTWLPNIR
jgi:hypothetical protein